MDPRGFIAFVSILIGTSPFVDAAALGLGDAELRSRLNEPLEVEIDVVGAAPQSDGLNATIGTKARRYSADPAALALSSRLRAEVAVDAAGRAHIRVTTERAVREPVVSFLLVVENAREHVMREYTLLLDPPGYSMPVLTMPEPVRAAVVEPAPAIPVPAPPAPPTPNPKIDTERIGPVARGDTLSRLAMEHGTGPGVTWAQMTWALFRMNPHAFIDGNINKLRSNVYLEIPSRATASRWSHRQALDLITAGRSTSGPTRQRAPSPVVPSTVVGEPSTKADPPAQESQATEPQPTAEAAAEPPRPLFRVLSSGDMPPARSAGTVGAPTGPRERERLRQLVAEANRQIRDSREEIVRARKQLAETALQISNLVETVEKKNSDIKSLESRLADLREFVQQRSVAAADPDPNWLQRLVLEALILVTLVTLVTLVGVLAVTLARWNDARRRMGGNVESGAIALEFHAPTVNPAPPPAVPVEDEEAAELPAEDPVAETDDAEQASTDHTEHEEIELHGDQLMEANAYLAYGYHEKAKEVLEEFIKENPAHAESRLVMLRALHAIKEQRKFRRHAEALLELVDDEYDERWIEAARLGRAILPEERLFDADAHKRTEDEKFEQTVWTGARASTTDEDDHTYLDFDEFKYVDLFLLDGGGAAPDVQDPTTPAPSAEEAEAKTEAELAKWRADMLGTEEDRGVRLDPDAPTDDSTDVPDDEPLDDPVDVPGDGPLDDPVDVPGDGPLDGPIDFSLDDPTEVFLDTPTDVPTAIPTDDEH